MLSVCLSVCLSVALCLFVELGRHCWYCSSVSRKLKCSLSKRFVSESVDRCCYRTECLDLHGAAACCLSEMCTPVAANTGRRHLRSASHGDLLMPRTRTRTTQFCSLWTLHVWNDLPLTLYTSPGPQDSSKARGGQYCMVQPTQHDLALASLFRPSE